MIKLFGYERSGHAHRVRLFLSLLEIEYLSVDIPILEGAGRSEAYLALNPFGLVPVLDDDGVVIRDSNAILVYLATKHDPACRWLPRDPEGTARVHEWLATATHDLVVGPAYARAVTQFGRPFDLEVAQKRAHRLLRIMEAHLADRTWLALERATLADIAMYTYTALAPEGGVPLEAYPNVRRWLAAVEALDRFVGILGS